MCTILLAVDHWAQRPLVMAANRDEFLARPAQGPRVRELPGAGQVFAPLDVQAGGTWMGVARGEAGEPLLVAVTNRATGAPDPKRRSRGLLVAEALGAGTLADARRWAEGVDAADYNPFHLVVASRQGAFELWNHDDRSRVLDLGPGLHVITERYAGDAAGPGAQAKPSARPQLARELLAEDLKAATAPSIARWAQVLGHRPSGREAQAIDAMTVRIDGAPYGTRSASVVELAAGTASLWWAEGAPDRAPFRAHNEALQAWLHSGQIADGGS